jgi:CRISPR-associated protein Cas1
LDKTKTISFTIPNVPSPRTDFLDIKERILDMMPEERKKLGINKSTLWYQRKNLAEGKKIKVYNKVLSRII